MAKSKRLLYLLSAQILSMLVMIPGARAAPPGSDLADVAERYLRGVYGCQPTVVTELASPDVVVTYPIFQQLFGKAAFRGRDEVVAFANHFCKKWSAGTFVMHQTVSDGQNVVIMWGFSARRADDPNAGARTSWGGITLLRFNSAGQITAEIGEESTPGPFARLGQQEVE